MKIRSVRRALALALLLGIGVFFACTSTPENGNRAPANQIQSVNANADRPALAEFLTACQAPQLGTKRDDVQNALSILYPAGTRTQLKVQIADNKNLRILFEGTVDPTNLADLYSNVGSFMQTGCVINVYLVRQGTITANTANTVNTADPSARLQGFRWGGCEGDMIACPDGSCAPQGQCPTKQMSNTNTNVNTNTNSRANSNANGNATP